jgi:hypothetical protein
MASTPYCAFMAGSRSASRARVEELHVAAEGPCCLRHHERRAGHVLHAAGHVQVAFAHSRSRARRRPPHSTRSRTEPVHRLARHGHGQAREQQPPCAPRCGCPRRPGWRSPGSHRRSRRRRGSGAEPAVRAWRVRREVVGAHGAERAAERCRSACGRHPRCTPEYGKRPSCEDQFDVEGEMSSLESTCFVLVRYTVPRKCATTSSPRVTVTRQNAEAVRGGLFDGVGGRARRPRGHGGGEGHGAIERDRLSVPPPLVAKANALSASEKSTPP